MKTGLQKPELQPPPAHIPTNPHCRVTVVMDEGLAGAAGGLGWGQLGVVKVGAGVWVGVDGEGFARAGEVLGRVGALEAGGGWERGAGVGCWGAVRGVGG